MSQDTTTLDALFAGFRLKDCLGPAAAKKRLADEAKKNGELNAAWRLLQEVKEHYLEHAIQCKFTGEQTLALDGSVSEAMADILRLEARHDDALVHTLYCIATSPQPTKCQMRKLGAYLRRSRAAETSPQEVDRVIAEFRRNPNFQILQHAVFSWRSHGDA